VGENKANIISAGACRRRPENQQQFSCQEEKDYLNQLVTRNFRRPVFLLDFAFDEVYAQSTYRFCGRETMRSVSPTEHQPGFPGFAKARLTAGFRFGG
jgi:hypothetical protein